jgi:D-alanyl-D-alanine carboxypeptidase
MPWSLHFFGNFFIHGWPYYPDGTPVPDGYSGGCVRLSSGDAERVFAFAERGTPIFVAADDRGRDQRAYTVRARNRPLPALSARAFIVADVASGAVFAERDAERAFPLASLTKLMTAVVANETISFDRPIAIVDPHAEGVGDYGALERGDSLLVGDTLYPLLLESNNAVAHALARELGEEQFLSAMNEKAAALGMKATHFADASGISSHSVGSATDLFAFARYLAGTKSFILGITRTKTKNVTALDGESYAFASRNRLVAHELFYGGKTGFTEDAGETMLTIFNVPIGGGRATSTLAIAVLGSGAREEDTKALLGWFRGAAVAVASSSP